MTRSKCGNAAVNSSLGQATRYCLSAPEVSGSVARPRWKETLQLYLRAHTLGSTQWSYLTIWLAFQITCAILLQHDVESAQT
jgi:hypothetical protein